MDAAEIAVQGLAGGDTFIVFIKKIEGEPIGSYQVLMETSTPGVHRLRTITACLLEELIDNVPGRDLQRLIAEWYRNYSEEHEWQDWHLSPNDVDKMEVGEKVSSFTLANESLLNVFGCALVVA